MSNDLTNSQVALLCAIEEHDHARSTEEQKRDLELLVSEGYVEASGKPSGPAFRVSAKGVLFLGERGAGLNEA
jgi:hypothetical protein